MDKHDEDIIKRFVQGDEQAFRVLYDQYAIGLRYFAAGYVNDDTEIEDMVQDAFVALWEKRADFQEEQSIKAYLYQAVRNDCLNLKRHRKVQERYAEQVTQAGEEGESFLDRMLESEIYTALLEVFEELPAACKKVYRMSLEGMSHEEIAERLHITINTVKKHKNNANHYMKERLKHVLSLFILLSGY